MLISRQLIGTIQAITVGMAIVGFCSFEIQRVNSQESRVFPQKIDKATLVQREQHRAEQAAYTTPDRYDWDRYPLTAEQETHWRRTLWASAILEPDHPQMGATLDYFLGLTLRPTLSETEARLVEMALQISHQFYDRSLEWQGRLRPALEQTIEASPDPYWVAMAFATVMSSLSTDELDSLASLNNDRAIWIQRTNDRLAEFQELAQKPGNHLDQDSLLLLEIALQDAGLKSNLNPNLPPLEEWLNWQIQPGELQLFVLCAETRSQLCYTVLKDGSGQWVKDSQDSTQLWSVPLAGRSLHGLPWYLSRGETPQGVYRLEGVIPQPDTDFFYAYGFFPLLNLYVPHEPGVRQFLPDRFRPLSAGTIRQLTDYQQLLPPGWRNYFPVQQTYWAGRLGRSLFRIHGTGEAIDFFANNDRYPYTKGWNPAIGCLTALEQYDESGNLVKADMPVILETLRSAQLATTIDSKRSPENLDLKGYIIVLNVPDPLALIEQKIQNISK